MKGEFIKYLNEIGITGALIPKIEEIVTYYEKFLGYQLDDIIVSDYLNQDGSRVYENVWFFNKELCFEAKQFLTQEDYDTDIVINSVEWFSMQKTDYDIVNGKATEKSRMSIEFGLHDGRSGEIKASRENCKYLAAILKKYIQPNYATKK